MALPMLGKERLQFGNIRHILLAQQAHLRTLYAEKFEHQRILLSLGVTYDQKFKRMIVPKKGNGRYQHVFRKLLNIQVEINSVHRIIQMKQAEIFFSQMAD